MREGCPLSPTISVFLLAEPSWSTTDTQTQPARANSPKMQNKGRMSRQESKQTQDWTIGPRAIWSLQNAMQCDVDSQTEQQPCGIPNWTTALCPLWYILALYLKMSEICRFSELRHGNLRDGFLFDLCLRFMLWPKCKVKIKSHF